MPDRDNLIHKALMCATSLNAREKKIAIEAWLLAKRSHDTLSSAWAASKEKVQLAENDDEAKEYWAKFEGVRAQYALIDKIAQQKEQLAQKWRPSKVIYIDDDEEDSARGYNDATESSPEAVEIRNMNPQKSMQTSDEMSVGRKTYPSAIPQLSLDELLRSTVSIRRHRKKQGTKRRAEEIEDDPLSIKKTSSKQEPEKPASPRKVFMRIPDQKKRQKSLD
ncbi:hypothetical protein COL940_002558 [Colletotrichum noveboracense]|nr:hypothetical protein COL940_002558 [Colletotrichum noveboracense]KAJ0293519.1 hypothetical protein CBS470a_001724 [Colletotrichum nupharicola]